MSSTLLRDVADEIADYLAADSYFTDIAAPATDVPVFAPNPKDLTDQGEIAIGQVHVAAVVLVSRATTAHPNVPGPYINNIEVQVAVYEHRRLNATGKCAEEIAAYAMAILQHYRPPSALGPLYLSAPGYIEIPVEDEESLGSHRAVAVRFQAASGLQYQPTRVATPVITEVDADTFSIACATAGATIYYSIDGSNPTPSSPLYTGPTDLLATPVTVKARAYKTGLRASEIASLTMGGAP